MPVDDVAVHPKVRRDRHTAGCYDRSPPPIDPVPIRTFTGEVYFSEASHQCRQVGRKFNGAWIPLDECLGCKATKDEAYITKARIDIDTESSKFMKADQRVI